MGKRSEVTITICGIDPGKTTGLVVIEASGPGRLDRVLFAEQIAYDDAPSTIDRLLDIYALDVVAMERFTISERTIKSNRVNEPLDVIGGVKFLLALNDRRPLLLMQGSSDAKTAYSDFRLDAMGIGSIAPKPHGKDALRHALLATHKVAKHSTSVV